MARWLRHVWGSFWGAFDLLVRMRDLEDELERTRARMADLELHWENQVDKLDRIQKRQTKRIQDGTAALAEAGPTTIDMKAARAQRKAALRQRRAGGESG